MASHQCLRCRSALRQAFNIRQALKTCRIQPYGTTITSSNEPTEPLATKPTISPNEPPKPQLDIAALLSKPTWSVRSLLPAANSTNSSDAQTLSPTTTPAITPSQLHHLLRLSSLPQPSSPAEEETMLRILEMQLHFVRAIQAVDTTGVEPLVTLRDETEEGIKRCTIGLENPRIKEALAAERKVGRMGRVRRRKEEKVEDRRSEEEKQWDPLQGAKGRTAGRYFVVHSGKSSSGVGGIREATGAVETYMEEKEAGETNVLEKSI